MAVGANTRIDRLSLDVATLTMSHQAQLMSAPRSHVGDSKQIGRGQQPLVDDDHDWQKSKKRSQYIRSISILSFSLILPRWLAQYSLQISVCRAAQNWTLNLKPYRTVPQNNELWTTIIYGDYDKLRQLIDSRQATVFDRNLFGFTPLHVWSLHFVCCASPR
jgi:hypothetical protein